MYRGEWRNETNRSLDARDVYSPSRVGQFVAYKRIGDSILNLYVPGAGRYVLSLAIVVWNSIGAHECTNRLLTDSTRALANGMATEAWEIMQLWPFETFESRETTYALSSLGAATLFVKITVDR